MLCEGIAHRRDGPHSASHGRRLSISPAACELACEYRQLLTHLADARHRYCGSGTYARRRRRSARRASASRDPTDCRREGVAVYCVVCSSVLCCV